MTEQMTLEDVLNGKEEVIEPETAEVETEAAEPEAVEVVEEETEEVTEDPTEGVEEVEPPATENVKEVPLAAMLDERDKRKALQVEVERLKAEQETATKEKVDFWENPEAAIDAKVEERIGKVEQQFTNGYLSLSMQYSRSFHDDFDAAKDAFATAAQENPALADMALKAEMPGEYIYSTGKQFMELESVGGDVNALRERIRNEERAKLTAEFEAKGKARQDIPVPLTDETSATPARQKVEGGNESLDSILNYNSG